MSRGEAAPRPVRRGSKAVSKSDNKTREKNATGRCLLQPLSENLLYCSPGGNERSQENNMLFLLRHGDAGNLCQPCAQPRHRPSGETKNQFYRVLIRYLDQYLKCEIISVSGSLSNNKGSVCIGGKCRRTSVTTCANEKVSRSSRSPAGSRGASFDTCVRARDGNDNLTINIKTFNVSNYSQCFFLFSTIFAQI